MNYSVEIRPEAVKRIIKFAGASADGRETGGILLGRGPDTGGVIVVEQAGDPGPDADRRPDFFLRDLGHAQALAAEAWERDRAVWVGEWHTHPGGPLHPSPRDLGTYTSLVANTDLAFRAFVAIIVIPERDFTTPRLVPWVLAPSTRSPEVEEPDPPKGESPS